MAEADGRHVMIDGLAVYPHHQPGAPRVVVVHGSMDRAASFIKAIRRLRDLDVIRYDRRGYGRSVGAGVCGAFSDQVDDLLAVLDGTPAVVIGHSVGGVIALATAQRRPDLVTAVGAFEAPMPWAPWWPARSAGGEAMQAADDGGRAAAERFMRRMIGDDRWEGLPPATREARRNEGPALLGDLRGMRQPMAPYDLDRIESPIVAGRGTASDAHHQRAAEDLAERASHGELVVIEGADHGAHFSHPDAFAAFIRQAVERSRERGSAAG
jgi:pimeloyl-ACP methyl ester carboxylesterase